MKRVILCVSVLVFWILTFSTIFSLRVEQWMVPSVTTLEPEFSFADKKGHVPLDCLFETETGNSIFTIYEGTMWEAGTRARALLPADYTVTPEDVQLICGSVINYATKIPRSGEPVNVVLIPDRQEDRWLAVAKDESLPELGEFAVGVSIEEQTERELLLYVEKVPQPFMEKRAQSMVPVAGTEDDLTPWTDNTGEVDWESVDWEAVEAERPEAPSFYSLIDLENWMEQMPKIGLLVGSVLASLFLWVGSFVLSKECRKNRRYLLVNGLLMLIPLGALPILLHYIDLPSSLLPGTHIVDFGYYAQEFGDVFGALNRFAAQGSQAADGAIHQVSTMLWMSVGLAAAIIIIAIGICMAEIIFSRKVHAHNTVKDEQNEDR